MRVNERIPSLQTIILPYQFVRVSACRFLHDPQAASSCGNNWTRTCKRIEMRAGNRGFRPIAYSLLWCIIQHLSASLVMHMAG